MGSKTSSMCGPNGPRYSEAYWELRLELQPCRDALLGPRTPLSPAEPSILGPQIKRLQDDDNQVVLVLRDQRESGAFLRCPVTKDQVVILPLTWRQLLNRLEHEVEPSRLTAKNIVRFGEVSVNVVTMEVRRLERLITLTKQQFKLLKFLMLAPEQVFSRDELLNQVWGYHHYPSTRTVDNHILVLRQKLEPSPAHPVHFLTVHGSGYKFIP
jgi:DNA-binding response OmpR family regulator